MARTCGGHLRAVLAGAIICWAAAGAVAVGQEGGEVTEDLGNSYVLARRTSSSGSIIETLLFDGQPIATEIAVPAADAGATAGTTGVGTFARSPAGNANAARGDAANRPPGMGAGFDGTLLTGEIVGDYLVLHRTRASGPVVHEIFHEGSKVGSVTEVSTLAGAARAGRNSFAFESADDRFVVYLTQPDGTRIRATTEHGRFSGQVVERVATTALPSRSSAGVLPSGPSVEPGKPIGRAPEVQRAATPQEPVKPGKLADRGVVDSLSQQIVPSLPETVPLPRPFPIPRLRPVGITRPVQTASPTPSGLYRSPPGSTALAPIVRPKPAVTPMSGSSATAARPVVPAAGPVARPKAGAAAMAIESHAAARSTASASASSVSAAKPKPTTANARLSRTAPEKPGTSPAKPLRPPSPSQ